MNDESGLTPEEHLQAAFDHLGKAARQWASEARQAMEPMVGLLGKLVADAEAQAARLRRFAENDVTRACDCQCAKVHPGSWVCDKKAVTTIRRPDPTGPVDVPVCAPCAAEVMSQQL